MIRPAPSFFSGQRRVIALAAVASIAIPAAILWPRSSPQQPTQSGIRTIVPRPVPPHTAALRPLFLAPLTPGDAAIPDDAPILTGIAGRLPHDAIAMVRNADGSTRILAIGQEHQGWRLASLSSDAALFARGPRRLRVALPANDEPPASFDQ